MKKNFDILATMADIPCSNIGDAPIKMFTTVKVAGITSHGFVTMIVDKGTVVSMLDDAKRFHCILIVADAYVYEDIRVNEPDPEDKLSSIIDELNALIRHSKDVHFPPAFGVIDGLNTIIRKYKKNNE